MTNTAALGRFIDRNTFRFEIRYPHPPGRVWRAITEVDALAAWFLPIEIELRVGGTVLLHEPEGAKAEGIVTALVAEVLLEFAFGKGAWQWPEGALRFELAPDGDGCRLVFTQRVAPGTVWAIDPEGQVGGPGTLHPGACAGWHGHFAEGLARYLDGRPEPLYDDVDDLLMAERTKQYAEILGQ